MTIPLTPRRRARAQAAGSPVGAPPPPAEQDALAALRDRLAELDPDGFASCFTPGGWVRVPRPEGDVVLRGRAEIARAGYELRSMLADLTWTPSQRFVASGQVVEEAVARARVVPVADLPGDAIRVPMRVVAVIDPAGAVANLTIWVDWAALRDPHGVDSARGAASALVALARARDARGLRVIESEPGAAPRPPAPREPIERPARPAPPTAPVLWWRRNRTTLAGSAMALAAAALIVGVGHAAMTPPRDEPLKGADLLGAREPAPASPAAAAPSPTPAPVRTTAPRPSPRPSPSPKKPAADAVPRIAPEETHRKPTVQDGVKYDLQAELLFDVDSYTLNAPARSLIAHVADQVRRARVTGNIQVNGYTDSIGSDAYNLALSRRRALAVAQALAVELKGLPVRLTPQGFGEGTPVADNTTLAGRARNRHVTVVLPPPG
jgi:outer membrane protein OmpA-like peptidoglycan-associated protein